MQNQGSRSGAVPAILWGGGMAGFLDLLFAFVLYGRRVGPVRVLQSIASGLLGADAYKGGSGMAALGFVLHFVIALGAAAVFYAASRKLGFLVRASLVCGLLYGIAVYLFMNFVVLPLSAFPGKPSYPLQALAIGILGHMFLVGLPIALAVRRFSRVPAVFVNS
jgi:uncharacterized membrane protein YagU involved in acid resistance